MGISGFCKQVRTEKLHVRTIGDIINDVVFWTVVCRPFLPGDNEMCVISVCMYIQFLCIAFASVQVSLPYSHVLQGILPGPRAASSSAKLFPARRQRVARDAQRIHGGCFFRVCQLGNISTTPLNQGCWKFNSWTQFDQIVSMLITHNEKVVVSNKNLIWCVEYLGGKHVPPSASPGAVSLRIVPDMEKLPEDWQQLSTPKWRVGWGCRSWFR